jgi:hypothetical protein
MWIIFNPWLDLALMAVLTLLGLGLIFYGWFLENPESPRKYYAEVIIGGIITLIALPRFCGLIALLN